MSSLTNVDKLASAIIVITPDRTESHPWERRSININRIRTYYTRATCYIFRTKFENPSKIKITVLNCYRSSLCNILLLNTFQCDTTVTTGKHVIDQANSDSMEYSHSAHQEISYQL
jgi:hypothetical protein